MDLDLAERSGRLDRAQSRLPPVHGDDLRACAAFLQPYALKIAVEEFALVASGAFENYARFQFAGGLFKLDLVFKDVPFRGDRDLELLNSTVKPIGKLERRNVALPSTSEITIPC